MKNNRHLTLLQTVSLLLSLIPLQTNAMEFRMQSGATFDWWDDNKQSSASQLTIPLQFTGTKDNLSLRLVTGYTRTSLDTGGKDISMSGMLDTKVGASYRIADGLPFELLLGLDLNLPTGKTNLSSDETRLVMDPDLLPINSYGEGFNINPTVTVAKGLDNWTFALGLGSLWRGRYDFSSDLQDYQPGMVFNTFAEARYYYRAKSYARLYTGYTVYGTDTVDGENLFREGDVFQVGGGIIHAVNPDLKFTAGVKGVIRGDVKNYNTGTGSSQNLNAYNGDETVIDMGCSYAIDKLTSFTVPLQLRFMAANGNSGEYHVGAKEKISLGGGVTRELIPGLLSGDLTIKGYYKHDDPTRIPDSYDERSFTGLGVAASVTGRF